VHTAVRWGVRAGGLGLAGASRVGLGPDLEAGGRGRFVRSALNGLLGDRLEEDGSPLAITMAVRRGGRDVPVGGLAEAHPTATGRVAVLLHGLCENEEYWDFRREALGTTYPDLLRELGWTPLLVRYNSGRPVRSNGADLSGLLREVVTRWPVPVTRVALVGHSMGGLVARAAGGLRVAAPDDWTHLVSDVVCLGTPHRGAPIAGGLHWGSGTLSRLPETAAFGRAIDRLSQGVRDLVEGLGDDVPPPPGARLRLVSAALGASPEHPLSRLAGDLLVGVPSAYGEARGHGIFPDADRLHLPASDHFDLLNDPAVHEALRRWLA